MQKYAVERQNSAWITVSKNTTVQLQSDRDWNCSTKVPKLICHSFVLLVCQNRNKVFSHWPGSEEELWLYELHLERIKWDTFLQWQFARIVVLFFNLFNSLVEMLF